MGVRDGRLILLVSACLEWVLVINMCQQMRMCWYLSMHTEVSVVCTVVLFRQKGIYLCVNGSQPNLNFAFTRLDRRYREISAEFNDRSVRLIRPCIHV